MPFLRRFQRGLRRRLLRWGEFVPVRTNRLQHDLVEAGAVRLVDMREQRPPHPRIPGTPDVHGRAAHPLGPIGKAPVELPDLIGHPDQFLDARHEVIR